MFVSISCPTAIIFPCIFSCITFGCLFIGRFWKYHLLQNLFLGDPRVARIVIPRTDLHPVHIALRVAALQSRGLWLVPCHHTHTKAGKSMLCSQSSHCIVTYIPDTRELPLQSGIREHRVLHGSFYMSGAGSPFYRPASVSMLS